MDRQRDEYFCSDCAFLPIGGTPARPPARTHARTHARTQARAHAQMAKGNKGMLMAHSNHYPYPYVYIVIAYGVLACMGMA